MMKWIIFLTSFFAAFAYGDLGDQGIRNWTLSNSTDSIGAVQSGPWTVTSSGTSTVTQGTSPWVSNISQFGGNNVVTGTGVSGLGIPRVTVSSDSSLLAVQSGTWTVQQGSAPWSVSQSGSWTVTANQGTSPWVSNISQFGGSNVVTGTGASGSGIPRVTVSNDSNILATQSGTWTVQQGTPPWQFVGNVSSAATDSGNPVKTGGIYNTTQPTVTTGQRVDTQSTARGAQIVATGVDNFVVQQGTPPWSVVGNVASAATDSGNPVKIGGIYHSATQTFSDGQRTDLQMNVHGSQRIDATTTDVTGTFTTTGTTSAIDGSGNGSIGFTVDVSASSGTTPTLDVQLQESDDGTNDWTEIYDADRFTTTGAYKSMRQSLHARYYRFRYVIGGSSPSFTFTVRTTLKPFTAPIIHVYNKFNDLVMTSSNNFSSIVNVEGCSFWTATLTRGAGGAGVAIVPQFSNDGINWVNGTSTNTSASTTFASSNNVSVTMTKYARFTNTNNQAAATTLDIKWYCKE